MIGHPIYGFSGHPPSCWLLSLQNVGRLNFTSTKSLGWAFPLIYIHRPTVYVSLNSTFHWYQSVFYKLDEGNFPSETGEVLGYFISKAIKVGHNMTFNILTNNKKVIYCSALCPADNPIQPILPLTDLFNGEKPSTIVVKSIRDLYQPNDYPNHINDRWLGQRRLYALDRFCRHFKSNRMTFLVDGKEEWTK